MFALMSSGMSDLLQLPADKEIGMIDHWGVGWLHGGGEVGRPA